jgi:hypothetical protein
MISLMRRIGSGVRPVRRPEIPDYHWSLISRCWATDPALRPSFYDVLEEFIRTGEYVFPGSDMESVRAYESVMKDCCCYSRPKFAATRTLTDVSEHDLEELGLRPDKKSFGDCLLL